VTVVDIDQLRTANAAACAAFPWIRTDLTYPENNITIGAPKTIAARIQELLYLNGAKTSIDGVYGAATEACVKEFQGRWPQHLTATGKVDQDTYLLLCRPILEAVQPVSSSNNFLTAVRLVAKQHLGLHPVEIGGQNKGPWVRLYMKGQQGTDYPWCAGFVSFVLKQAALSTKTSPPVSYTFSCDDLAKEAKARRIFVAETGHAANPSHFPAIFLCRKTPNDWTHTGLVMDFRGDTFSTIEGNTNDSGSAEGYEVCGRTRGIANKDFITLG